MNNIAGLNTDQMQKVSDIMSQYPDIGSLAIDCVLYDKNPEDLRDSNKSSES